MMALHPSALARVVDLKIGGCDPNVMQGAHDSGLVIRQQAMGMPGLVGERMELDRDTEFKDERKQMSRNEMTFALNYTVVATDKESI
jgi:hypothetical protein